MQIIIRARQAHLYAQHIEENRQLTPDTLEYTQLAWTTFFFKNLSPSLATPPTEQDWTAVQVGWVEIQEREKDPKWVEVQKARDEKWSLSMGILKIGFEAIKAAEADLSAGRVGEADTLRLFDANKDPLYCLLDQRVSPHQFSTIDF